MSREISQRFFFSNCRNHLSQPSLLNKGCHLERILSGQSIGKPKGFTIFSIWTYISHLSGCHFTDSPLQQTPEAENLLSFILQKAGRQWQLSSLKGKADFIQLKARMKNGKFHHQRVRPGAGRSTRTSKSAGSKHRALSQLSHFLRYKSHFRQPNSL